MIEMNSFPDRFIWTERDRMRDTEEKTTKIYIETGKDDRDEFVTLTDSERVSKSGASVDTSHLIMVIILDGNSDIGAHVRTNLCYLISSRHFIRSMQSQIFFFADLQFAICSLGTVCPCLD